MPDGKAQIKHRPPRHSFKKPEPVRDTREQFMEGWAPAGRLVAEMMLAAKGMNRG